MQIFDKMQKRPVLVLMVLLVISTTLAVWLLHGTMVVRSQIVSIESERDVSAIDTQRRLLEEAKGALFDKYLSGFEVAATDAERKLCRKASEKQEADHNAEKQKLKEEQQKLKDEKSAVERELKEIKEKYAQITAAEDGNQKPLVLSIAAHVDQLNQILKLDGELAENDKSKLQELQNVINTKLI